MRLQTPLFAVWLLLVVHASIAEGRRVLDNDSVKLSGPQTLSESINAENSAARTRLAQLRNARGSYQAHVDATLRGVGDISGVIRVVVFRNTTSVNI
ncbi:unnamed protein product, partial [Closterium sp. NIES-53]